MVPNTTSARGGLWVGFGQKYSQERVGDDPIYVLGKWCQKGRWPENYSGDRSGRRRWVGRTGKERREREKRSVVCVFFINKMK